MRIIGSALTVTLAISLLGATADGQAAPPLRLELRTTVDGNKVEFGRIGAIVADREGRMYVADVDRTAQQIVVLNADGSRLRVQGGRGQGPGQFSNLLPTLAWLGDKLLAVEYAGGGRRVTLFNPDGSVAATHSRVPAGGAVVRANEPSIRLKPVRSFTGGASAFLLEVDAAWLGEISRDRPPVTA